MNEEERCNTTLGLGLGVGMIKGDKQYSKSDHENKGVWLDLSLHLHPKVETSDDHDHDDHCNNNNDKKDDQGSFSSKTIDDQGSFSSKTVDDHVEKDERRIKRSSVSHGNDRSRKKLKLTTEQTTLLEDRFNIHSTLNTGQKQELARKLNLLPRQIEVWFQNRRARTKMKQIEKECELLKKCCESLNDENRRLKKELQEVRFFMRYPSNTTTRIDKSGEDRKEKHGSR